MSLQTAPLAEKEDDADKIISSEIPPYVPEPGGLGKTFFARMKSYGNAVAQVDGYTGEADTYNDLLQRCVRTAITMRRKGLVPGDVITIFSYNDFNTVVPFIGGLFIGALSANIDPASTLAEAVNLIKQVRPKMVFVGVETVDLIENCLKECHIEPEIIVFGKSETHTEFSTFLEASPDEETQFSSIEVDLQSTAIICFTSGTTGVPKGICLPHYGILCQAQNCTNIVNGYLVFYSLQWISAVYATASCVFSKGYRIIVPELDLDRIWDILSRVVVSTMFLLTYHASLLANTVNLKGKKNNLHTLVVSGTYVNAGLITALQKLLPSAKILVRYGLTESCGPIMGFDENSLLERSLRQLNPTSAGRVLPGFILKVVNPETEQTVGPYEHGELRLKCNSFMNGYYNVHSSHVWDSDRWFKTGDIVYYDDQKCFFIVDRLRDLIRVMGEDITPSILEGILLSHPSIEAAAVVGLPHPLDGEHPSAMVVLKHGAIGMVKAEDIVKYVEDNAHDLYKLRGGVTIVNILPLTGAGKVSKLLVKQAILGRFHKVQ